MPRIHTGEIISDNGLDILHVAVFLKFFFITPQTALALILITLTGMNIFRFDSFETASEVFLTHQALDGSSADCSLNQTYRNTIIQEFVFGEIKTDRTEIIDMFLISIDPGSAVKDFILFSEKRDLGHFKLTDLIKVSTSDLVIMVVRCPDQR